jgi:hypothetical protein
MQREIVAPASEPEVGLVGPAPELRRSGCAERIDDPTRVRQGIAALFKHGARGTLRHAGGTVALTADVFAQEADVLRWRVEGPIGAPPFVAELVGLNSIHCMHLDRGFSDGEFLMTPVPSAILRLRRRWLRRAEVSSGLDVSFACSGAQAILGGPVRNLSYQGIAFELERPVDFLRPGTRIDDLRIFDRSGKSALVSAEVRCVVPVLRGGCQYGLQVLKGADSRRYVELVNDQLHPGTRVGGRWAEHLWDLYASCGYFNLSGKEPAAFARRKSAFVSMARQLDHAPHLGCHVVWPHREPEGATAALSALKIYDRSWLGFQMAKIKGDIEGVSSRRILREIHLRTYEHIQRDPNVGWIIGYAQVKRVWTAHVHYDLPMRYVETGEADVLRFRALEVDTESDWKLDAHATDGVEVAPAAPAEVDAFARKLQRMRTPVYCDALDLVPGRMMLEQNRQAWNGMRFERDRQILLARRNGIPVAAAVLEVAADGTHLFGLLDLVRLYPLAAGGEQYFVNLLEAAKDWFRDYGKPQFVCFLETGTKLPDEIVARMNDMGEADMTILAAHRIPELLEHLYEVTPPR